MTAVPTLYRVAVSVLAPLYRAKLYLKRAPIREIGERFGKDYAAVRTTRPLIWCHAVSLGETNTVEPILQGLLAAGYALWITNTTQTGYARVGQLFGDELAAGMVYQSFVPVDNAAVIERFLAHVKPVAALFVETELWATTLAKLNQQQIASILVNARLSDKSFHGYQRAKRTSRSMMDNLTLIIAQDEYSAKRFRQLGATSDKIRVASSLKWSSKTNPLMIRRAMRLQEDWQLAPRRVIVAASTHAGEEALIWQAVQALPNARAVLLIVVPRHPERFDAVAEFFAKQTGNAVPRRSQHAAPSPQDSVYLADSMGELGVWYALADIALVGGSWVDIGGHNPIEAAVVAKPIIMGQYTQACQAIVDKLHDVGALQQAADAPALSTILTDWLARPDAAAMAGRQGQALAKQHQDATYQQLAMILDCLDSHHERRVATQVRLIDNAPPPTQTDGKTIIDDFVP